MAGLTQGGYLRDTHHKVIKVTISGYLIRVQSLLQPELY
jgi:hypothetical protein